MARNDEILGDAVQPHNAPPSEPKLVDYVAMALAPAVMLVLWWLDARESLPVVARGRALHAAAVALVAIGLLARGLARRGSSARGRTKRLVAALVAASAVLALGVSWRARYMLPASSPSTRLALGASPPDGPYLDDLGRPTGLTSFQGRPTLVVWFRGAWCPYCRKQLRNLQAAIHPYRDLVNVVAITGDPPELTAPMKKELGLDFPILSDNVGNLVGACELMHCVAVLDRKGAVRWEVVSGNWRQDIPERSLLQRAVDE